MNDETKPTQNDSMHALRSSQRPSLGRVAHYTKNGDPSSKDAEMAGPGPFTSLICCVDDNELFVNLVVFDAMGQPHGRQMVALSTAPAGTPDAAGRWAWPAYVPPTGGAR